MNGAGPEPMDRGKGAPSGGDRGVPDDLLTESIAMASAIGRNWLVVFAVLVFSVALGFVLLDATPQRYEARALLVFDNDSQSAAGMTGPDAGTEFLDTQVEILRSDRTMRRVIEQATFDISPKSLQLGVVDGLVARIRALLDLGEDAVPVDDEPFRLDVLTRLLHGATSVSRVGQARMLEIAAATTDPTLSARLVNHLVAVYLSASLENKAEGARLAQLAIESQLRELERKIASTEAELEQRRVAAATQHDVNELGRMTSTLTSTRSVYEALYADFLRLEEQIAFPRADARLVGEATPPVRPSWPRASVIIAVAAVLGLSSGIAAVLVSDRWRRFRAAGRDTMA